MKILLVDDNLLNQKVVTYYLNKYNYLVESVGNGFQVIKKIMDGTYSLILMDIMLPGMNGYELTREIRKYEKNNKIEKQIPIIATTANTFDNDREKCLKSGMNDFLPKPFTFDELMEVINKYTDKNG